jgi:hypothetical protein
VGVKEAIVVGDLLVVRTTQNEIHVVESPGVPTRRAGSLPRNSSPLVHDGQRAWSVTTGRGPASRVRLCEINPGDGSISMHNFPPSDDLGKINLAGVAGADPHFIFLSPSFRFRRSTGILEAGHLESFPELQVLRTLNDGDATWYLASTPFNGARGEADLWLLHSPSEAPQWLKVPAGTLSSSVSLAGIDGDLFLVHRAGPVLRFDKRTLRFKEDLTRMLRSGEIDFFSADGTSYWVVTATEQPDQQEAELDFWIVDRETLDGGQFHAAAVPSGFAPLADDGSRIWFGAQGRSASQPLISVEKSGATAQAYSVTGKHARRWRAVGRAARTTVVGVGLGVVVTAAVAVAIVTAPIWVPIAIASS